MNDEMNERLLEENIAMRIIISVVMEELRRRPELKKQLVLASLDTALEGDALHVCATISKLLEA